MDRQEETERGRQRQREGGKDTEMQAETGRGRQRHG